LAFNRLRRATDGRPWAHGQPLRPNNLCKIFIREVIKSLAKQFPSPPGEIGFADGRVHSFRHVFVSQAFLHRAGEGEIKEWVGHRDSRIVERYRHLSNEDAKQKMSRIHFLDAPSKDKIKSLDCGNGEQNAAKPT
jgi:integrase